MSSTVTNFSNNINVSYPIPGVDNDTQGFRDNFANIKNALQTAAQELSNLNLYTVKLNTGTNDYNYGATISRAKLQSAGFTINADSDNNLYFSEGNFQKRSVTGSTTLNVDGFPNTLYSKMTVEVLNATSGASSVTFDVPGILKKKSSLSLPMILSSNTTTSHIFDLWSTDGGENVFVEFVGTYTNV
jgi:hypothetical protein